MQPYRDAGAWQSSLDTQDIEGLWLNRLLIVHAGRGISCNPAKPGQACSILGDHSCDPGWRPDRPRAAAQALSHGLRRALNLCTCLLEVLVWAAGTLTL